MTLSHITLTYNLHVANSSYICLATDFRSFLHGLIFSSRNLHMKCELVTNTLYSTCIHNQCVCVHVHVCAQLHYDMCNVHMLKYIREYPC